MNEAQAAARFGFDGELVPGVRFASVCVTAVARLDRAEVERRAAVGLGAIVDHELTEALAQLPTDWPVRRQDLDPATLQLLEAAPVGVVELDAGVVTRRWQPALSLTGILLTSRAWQAGLRSVSLFAPDAPRGLVLSRPPHDPQQVTVRSRELGIGVLAPDSAGQWALLTPPLRAPSYAPGPRHWRLLETTYLAWCRLAAQRSAAQLLK